MSLDSDTIKIYEELKIAARDGNLLSYANKLARSMMGERVSVETGARETISNPDLIRPPTPQPRSPVRRELSEGSRVSNL